MIKKLLSAILILSIVVTTLSSKANALSEYEIYELFQQGGTTGNLVLTEEFNFFGHPISEIGTNIDTVEQIMRQNSLDVTIYEDNLSEQHQSVSVHGVNLNSGIDILADRITNNAQISNNNRPGEYDIFDTLTYKYYFTGGSHGANIGIRDICIGDSLHDFLNKLGFSDASALATAINSAIDAKYESHRIAENLLHALSYWNEETNFYFGLRSPAINILNSNTVLDSDSQFQTDLAHTPFDLSFGHTLRCEFYFQDNMLHNCEITFYTPVVQDNLSQSEGSNFTFELPAERLEAVFDATTSVEAVSYLVGTMTAAQKVDSYCIDLATLYAETAASKATVIPVFEDEILINASTVSNLESTAIEASAAVETALTNGGITTARYLSKTIIFTTDEQDISIQINPDVLTTEVDKIRVETPTYAVTFKLSDLEPDLTQPLTFTAQDMGTGYAAGSNSGKATVKVSLPNGRTSNSITVSLPSDNGDTTYQSVVSTDGQATASKYNPATTTMDGKINTSGTYTVKSNEKDFTDIANKSAEMQRAIRYLASKGIINGTTPTTFSPDGSINRAEIATLLVKALGKLDSTATASFSDVTKGNWFYTAAASSQRHKLINGYEDNTFRGTTNINKVQIVAVSSRVLTSEMNYKTPSNPSSYLGKYSDSIATWAQSEVALATKENLVVYRTDGTFSGDKTMTRGDAAIIIYRLFQRIW